MNQRERWALGMGLVHHAHHTGNTCACSTPPEPRPVTVAEHEQSLAEIGRRELAELREVGLPLNLDHVEQVDLVALGRSVQPARLDRLLDQIVTEREGTRPPPDSWTGTSTSSRATPPPELHPETAEDPKGSESEDATGQGQAAHVARSGGRGPDRNKKKTTMEKILAEGRDRIDFDDEE